MTLTEIQALARVGATSAAWSLLEQRGPDSGIDTASLTLRGRLLKDRARMSAGPARVALLREAGEAYAAAACAVPSTYPLINAATLSFLGGEKARAAGFAHQTLDLLASGVHEPDTRYWLAATRSEALLLLGREAEARAALRDAIAGTPDAWEDHAATLRQFRLILAEQRRPDHWLDLFTPPPAVHYAGPIGIGVSDAELERSIEAAVTAIRPGTASGALAAGFDIVAAEVLHRNGVQLHLVLPSGVADFVEISVRPFGQDWLARFERVMADAAMVETIDEPSGLSAGAVILAEEMALGLAVREAHTRDAEMVMLRMKGAGPDRASSDGLGSRTIEAVGGNVAEPLVPALPATPPRPVATVGCGPEVAEKLGRLAGEHVLSMPAGAFAPCTNLATAAEIAAILFDSDSTAPVILDYGLADADGSMDSSRLDILLRLRSPGYPIATRSAALALDGMATPFKTVVAGESTGLGVPLEFFSLWRVTPPGR